MELFQDDPEKFKVPDISDDYQITKEAKEILKNSIVEKKNWKRKDTMKYSQFIAPIGKDYVIGVNHEEGLFSIRQTRKKD